MIRKKSWFRRMVESVDFHSVGQHVWYEIAVPTIKSMISDMVSSGTERALFGEVRSRSRGILNSRTSYEKMYSGRNDRDRPPRVEYKTRARHSFEDVIFNSRGEAEEVLEKLEWLIETYDAASVSDFYDLIGEDGAYTDRKWGWYDLTDAQVDRTREGFILRLPRTHEID